MTKQRARARRLRKRVLGSPAGYANGFIRMYHARWKRRDKQTLREISDPDSPQYDPEFAKLLQKNLEKTPK